LSQLKIKFVYALKWAFLFLMQEVQKHSKHTVDIIHHSKFSFEDAMKYDVIFCANNQTWGFMVKRVGKDKMGELVKKRSCICSAASKKNSRTALKLLNRVNFRYVRVPSSVIKEYLEVRGCQREIRIAEQGINIDFFKPLNIDREGFTIGWAGKYKRREKRTHILNQLGYPLKIASGSLPRSKMADFYNSVNAYVHVSSTEGAPTTVLEAMACGLPVISTRVGLVPRLIEEEWITPVNPEEKVVELTKKKLSILENDIDLRRKVGQRNLMEIHRNWTSEIITKKWDKLFEDSVR